MKIEAPEEMETGLEHRDMPTMGARPATFAADPLPRRTAGGAAADRRNEHSVPIRKGADAFRVFVKPWYAGGPEQIDLRERRQPKIYRAISSILIGYARDRTNPHAHDTGRRFAALEESCSSA